MSLTVTFTNPLDLDEVWTYTKGNRSGFSFSTVINGGDDKLSISVPCNDLNLPPDGSVVRVWTDAPGWTAYPIWMGRLHNKHYRIEKRVVKAIDLECFGYYHEGDGQTSRKFLTDVVFGPVDTGSSPLTDKQITTDIRDAFIYACQQLMPDVQVLQSQLAVTGINLVQDTQEFDGQGAIEVFNLLATLTSYLSTPFVWEIYPKQGVPTLRFWTVDTSPSYFDDGESSQDLNYELESRVNQVTVEWGNNQRWTSPVDDGDPISYTAFQGVNILQDKYVTANREVASLEDVKRLARGYLQKFNVRAPSGSCEFTSDLRSNGSVLNMGHAAVGSSGYHPIEVIRAGRIIRCELSDEFLENQDSDDNGGPLSQLHTDHYIIETKYEESGDKCSVVCTFGEIGSLYREIRRLVNIPNRFTTWDTAFGSFGRPVAELEKAPLLGPEYVAAPDTLGSPFVTAVIPMAYMSNGTDSFGPHGGQLDPNILPTRRMGPIQQFATADASVVAVADNVKRLIALDWKNMNRYKITSKESATLTVEVNVNGVLVATCTLTAAISSAITTIPTFSTVLGDVITYDITANNNSTDFTLMIFGEADHPEFPSYTSPGA